MPRSVPIELLSFRRTFALLMVLVAVPSAGLTGLGVVAILNERAAVEKRLASVWQDRLDTLATRLRQTLDASTLTRLNGGVQVVTPSGLVLTGPGFRLSRDVLESSDTDLIAALTPLRIAALCPQLCVWRNTRNCGVFIIRLRISAAVASVLPSST